MAYIKHRVSVYGTQTDLLTAIKDFLLNNTLVQFTLLNEDLTSSDTEERFIELEYKGAYLKFSDYSISSTGYTYDYFGKRSNSGEITSDSVIVYHASTGTLSSVNTNRAVTFMLVKNNDGVAINIGSYNALYGQGVVTLITATTSKNTDIVGNYISGTNNLMKYYSTVDFTEYTVRPLHFGKKSETELWLDPSLAVQRANTYDFDLLDFTSLGGAEKLKFYKLENNDVYYAVDDNVAIKLNDEIVYEE